MRWEIKNKTKNIKLTDITDILLENREIKTAKDKKDFLNPPPPDKLSAKDVGIDPKFLDHALKRIEKAIENKESIVVYADYDADGITGCAVVWQTIYKLGGNIMPYIPHRVDEGYGFSIKGIDKVIAQHKSSLIISVDHGITAWEKVEYIKSKGIEVIVTDHHVKPKKLPDCTIIHTTELSGSGIGWFVAKELLKSSQSAVSSLQKEDLLAIATIGTIADMVPLLGANRSIVKFGLEALNKTDNPGLNALIEAAGLVKGQIKTYDVSFILAPRLNAVGRIVHALDALRLLVTTNKEKAKELAQKLNSTNRDRQIITEQHLQHALSVVENQKLNRFKLLIVEHESYNLGVIGLVAGKLVEQYYRPAIVVAIGEKYAKASARSVKGFNIIDNIRQFQHLLIDAGGHPMAAGFTVDKSKLNDFKTELIKHAEKIITPEMLVKKLTVDALLPAEIINEQLFNEVQKLAPFGMSNPEPMFALNRAEVVDAYTVGKEKQHLKLRLVKDSNFFSAIGFNMGDKLQDLSPETKIDVAFSLLFDTFNGRSSLQLKLKDIKI